MLTNITRWLLSVSIVLVVLAACQKEDSSAEQAARPAAELSASESVVAVTPDAMTEALNAWLDERYEEALQFSPMQLTMQGRKDLYDQIDEFTEQAARDQAAWRQKTVEQMKEQFDYNALTNIGKESFDLWVFQAEQEVADLEFIRHGYLFGELGGP